MRYFLLIICTLSLQYLQAQLHDRNWVFGRNNLLVFHEDSMEVKILNNVDSSLYVVENIGCISDSLGNLILYNSQNTNNVTDTPNQIIFNGISEINFSNSKFNSSYSTANGAIILPIDSINYLYVYLSSNNSATFYVDYKLTLKYHWIELKNNEWQYKKFAKDLFSNFYLSERLKAIKHPNGKDWWIIIQESLDSTCSDKILSILLSNDNILEINTYEGIKRCNHLSLAAEIAITKSGDKIAMAYYNDSIEVFNFNRCTGKFSNSKLYRLDNPYLQSYGLEFSPDGSLLYVNSWYRPPLSNGKLQQIKLSNGLITDLIVATGAAFQIERGPNDKLYFSYSGDFYKDSIFFPNANEFIHVIDSPNNFGLNCSLNLGKIKAINTNGFICLPNFPNYRLPSLSIFEAKAGRDTLICKDDSSSRKVVQLGSPTINGVSYQWYPNYNLSSDTTAQPLAFPDSTTWYYVTLTDTTIQDACQSRTDSVLVEVRKCSVGFENAILKTYDYKIHPTLIGSELRGYIVLNEKEEGYIELYDIMGNMLAVLKVKTGRNELGIPNHIHNGMVTYRVFVNNKLVRTDKIIIMK